MKVLLACEFSGVVREAFRKRGHEAYSCDLLPAHDNGLCLLGDVTRIVEGRFARVHREAPGPDRWKRRSITYTGIADAMADQWGNQ